MPVSSIDFYPTFAAVAGAKLKGKGVIDGVSLLPLWLGGNSLNRDALFWHYPSETGKWVNRMSSAVRKGDYKLIEFYKNKRLELYNLKDDMSEKHNLANELPEKTIELQKLLNSWRNEVNAETPVINKKSPPRKTDE
jgi:arylsulfatase A-like enzyme